MGYVVRYSSERTKKVPLFRWIMTSIFFVFFLMFSIQYWPEGRAAIMRFLLPDNSVAIEVFVDELAKEETILDLIARFLFNLF